MYIRYISSLGFPTNPTVTLGGVSWFPGSVAMRSWGQTSKASSSRMSRLAMMAGAVRGADDHHTGISHLYMAQNYGTNDPQKWSCFVGKPSILGVDIFDPHPLHVTSPCVFVYFVQFYICIMSSVCLTYSSMFVCFSWISSLNILSCNLINPIQSQSPFVMKVNSKGVFFKNQGAYRFPIQIPCSETRTYQCLFFVCINCSKITDLISLRWGCLS